MKALKMTATAGLAEGKQPRGVFRLYFEEARHQRPLSALSASRVAKPVAVQALVMGRQRVEAESTRLLTARGSIEATAHSLTEARAVNEASVAGAMALRAAEAIRDDLVAEFDWVAAPVAGGTVGAGAVHSDVPPPPVVTRVDRGATPNSYSPEQRAHQALELIEKIEVFVKSARPALALTLNNSLGARVEIERLGSREITLKLIGQNGLPSVETISCLREEMRARGLKVAAFSVA